MKRQADVRDRVLNRFRSAEHEQIAFERAGVADESNKRFDHPTSPLHI